MARRLEVGTGLAAAALSVLTLAMLLATPIVAVCPRPAPVGDGCSTTNRFITLAAAGVQVPASVWLAIIAMSLVILAGGFGAALDGMFGRRAGALISRSAGLLAALGWATMSVLGSSLSLFFLPPVLALGAAAGASLVSRNRQGTRATGAAEDRGRAQDQAAAVGHDGPS